MVQRLNAPVTPDPVGQAAGWTRAAVRLPQRTLAAMLSVQRPSRNTVLKQFQRRGLLAVGYRSIRILDDAALQRLAGGRL
jgi:CRP-like cAMP-binding protein